MNQIIGYDVEQKAAERKMNAWSMGLCEAVRGLQGMVGSGIASMEQLLPSIRQGPLK